MLRVRPIVFTPNFGAYSELFAALGLELVEDAAGWRVFAADSGRVAVCAADKPSVSFSFEVGSVEEFARRTVEAGTDAVVVDTADGRAAKVTTPGGRSFLAYEAPLRQAPPPREGLAVLPIWYTTDASAASRVFRDIGAKERLSSAARSRIDFTAKNGGLITVQEADRDGAEMAFECAGDVATLQERVSLSSALVEESYGRSLRLPSPDGGEIRVNYVRHGSP